MLWTQLNETSSRQNGVLSDLEPVHSTGQNRKKYATIIMSHSAKRMGFPKSVDMIDMCKRTSRGIGFN